MAVSELQTSFQLTDGFGLIFRFFLRLHSFCAFKLVPLVCTLAAPLDYQENWILAFARAQKDLENNPKKAEFGDDWQATIKAYPFLQYQLDRVIADLKSHLEYEKVKYKNINMTLPYTRVCVPVSPQSDTILL